MSCVEILQPSLPNVDINEVLRYAAIPRAGRTSELLRLAENAVAEACGLIQGKVCFATVSASASENVTKLGFAAWHSADFAHYVGDSETLIVFAATVGLSIDRLITAKSSMSPASAHMLEAVGNERIEALCDAFCAEAALRFGKLKTRYSPGYGDLALEAQRDIFKLLDPPRRIGLTLNDSLMMSPSKSVTALCAVKRTATK